MIGKQEKMKLPRVLIAVFDHELRSFLKHWLERAAYAVAECSWGNELDSLADAGGLEEFNLLLFDKRLLDQRVADRLVGLQQRQCSPPVVLVKSWYGQGHAEVDGLAVAAEIDKPADVAKFMALVRELAPHRPAEQDGYVARPTSAATFRKRQTETH